MHLSASVRRSSEIIYVMYHSSVIEYSFMRPNLSNHRNGTINDTISDNEKFIYNRIVASPGISAVALANEFGRSIITVKRAFMPLRDIVGSSHFFYITVNLG